MIYQLKISKVFVATIGLFLLLTFPALAQIQKTDSETDGLKYSVKSVLMERADLEKTERKWIESKRRLAEAITYDHNGNRVTWKYYDYLTGTLFDSVIYSRVAGNKVAIYEDVVGPRKIAQMISKPTNKIALPIDSRYTYKFKYKYDSDGNVSEEAWYQNDGALWIRYVYEINGGEINELAYSQDGSLNQKSVHTLDDKGNRIETHFYDTEKNDITSKETFEHLEFDAKGNWTKVIISQGDRENKFTMIPREVNYRTINYH